MIASLVNAGEDDIVFCQSKEYVSDLLETRSKYIITTETVLGVVSVEFWQDKNVYIVDNPRLEIAKIAEECEPEEFEPIIGGNVSIGKNTTIRNAIIGNNVTIGDNCSIGGDGFNYIDGVKFPHFGKVFIGEGVEIYNNVCIARGALSDTVIGANVKIDNLVHIAHNVHIREGTLVIANSMIGGSAVIGKNCWIAPSTSVNNGVRIGDRSMTGTGAVVVSDVGDNELVVGVPAKKLRDRHTEDK